MPPSCAMEVGITPAHGDLNGVMEVAVLWSLRSNRRPPDLGLMLRSTTLNLYTQTDLGPSIGFHSTPAPRVSVVLAP